MPNETMRVLSRLANDFAYDRKRGRIHRLPGTSKTRHSDTDASHPRGANGGLGVHIAGKSYQLAHIVFLIETTRWPCYRLTHKDSDPTNCAYDNLEYRASVGELPEPTENDIKSKMVRAFVSRAHLGGSDSAKARCRTSNAENLATHGVTPHYLATRFDYDETVGLTWSYSDLNFTRGNSLHPQDGFPGTPVRGYLDGDGYRYTTLLGMRVYHHKLIWCLMHGRWPEGRIRFIDGDRENLRYSNLVCHGGMTPEEELANREKVRAYELTRNEPHVFVPRLALSHHRAARIEARENGTDTVDHWDALRWACKDHPHGSAESIECPPSVPPEHFELYRAERHRLADEEYLQAVLQ